MMSQQQFKIGEKVVYPAHGVGVIESVQSRKISGTEKRFYMLRFLESDMTIMVPMENVASVGLRRIIGKDTVSKVYKILRDKKRRDRSADLEPALSRVHREDQDRLGSRDRQGTARSVRPEGRQGALLRRAEDARHGAQSSREGARDRARASRGEDHGRAPHDLRALTASQRRGRPAATPAGSGCRCGSHPDRGPPGRNRRPRTPATTAPSKRGVAAARRSRRRAISSRAVSSLEAYAELAEAERGVARPRPAPPGRRRSWVIAVP